MPQISLRSGCFSRRQKKVYVGLTDWPTQSLHFYVGLASSGQQVGQHHLCIFTQVQQHAQHHLWIFTSVSHTGRHNLCIFTLVARTGRHNRAWLAQSMRIYAGPAVPGSVFRMLPGSTGFLYFGWLSGTTLKSDFSLLIFVDSALRRPRPRPFWAFPGTTRGGLDRHNLCIFTWFQEHAQHHLCIFTWFQDHAQHHLCIFT